ncbi:MAG: minor capsid protein [Bacteroidales bacterium]|nr:minor capsid protein [Bacteroidales bacterium]
MRLKEKAESELPELYRLTDGAVDNGQWTIDNEIVGIIKELAQRIFNGEKITYDPDLLRITVKPYIDGIAKGYGKSLADVDWNTPDFKTLQKLTENVFQFSASKDFHILSDMTAALKDSNGKLRSFDDFQAEVDKMNVKYNGNWLRTEYNQAVAASQNAARWTDFEKHSKTMPFLQYQAVMDQNTRAEHAALNGVIKRIDSDFWDKYYPPNGWGCRCEVIQLPGKNYKETPDLDIKFTKVDSMFQVNVGKKGVVFPKGHPYFMGQCQRCSGPKTGLSKNYNPDNAQCQVCLLGQKACAEYTGDCLRQHYVQKANENIERIKQGIDNAKGITIENEVFHSGKMTIFKGSFKKIKEHGGENEQLIKYMSEFDLKDFSNWKYEGWGEVEAYKPGDDKYNPKKRNNGRHEDTEYFNYYSIEVNGTKLWANVKVRVDGVGENLYTIESKKPKKINPGEYNKKGQ